MRFALYLALAGAAFAARPGGPRIVTVVGTGAAGYSGDGGPASEAQINNPYGLTIGPDAALYICETDNHVVRRFDLRTRELSTAVGNARQGYTGDGGLAVDASLNQPYDVKFDPAGNMYIVEMMNHVIRRVDARTHRISTFAGNGAAGFSGDGGPAVRAQLHMPHSIAFDPQGHLLICDTGNQRIRRVDLRTGVIETFGGNGERRATPEGALLEGAPLNGPRAIEIDKQGNYYVALREGNRILRIDGKTSRVTHVAGSGVYGYAGDGGPALKAELSSPKAIALHDNSLYIADTESHTIRKVDLMTGLIATVVGTGERGDGPDGSPSGCRLARPHGVAVSPRGSVFVADSENHRVRELHEAPPRPPSQTVGPQPATHKTSPAVSPGGGGITPPPGLPTPKFRRSARTA
jgi:DNA-binding beta-propeller fold protein YncE